MYQFIRTSQSSEFLHGTKIAFLLPAALKYFDCVDDRKIRAILLGLGVYTVLYRCDQLTETSCRISRTPQTAGITTEIIFQRISLCAVKRRLFDRTACHLCLRSRYQDLPEKAVVQRGSCRVVALSSELKFSIQ